MFAYYHEICTIYEITDNGMIMIICFCCPMFISICICHLIIYDSLSVNNLVASVYCFMLYRCKIKFIYMIIGHHRLIMTFCQKCMYSVRNILSSGRRSSDFRNRLTVRPYPLRNRVLVKKSPLHRHIGS